MSSGNEPFGPVGLEVVPKPSGMRAVARLRSRRMFEWKYGFEGIYESTKRYLDVA